MFKYEMHQHTNGCSKCAAVNVKDMVMSVKENGFSGVVITNHFYHGNTAIDRDLPWVDFCKAYEDEFLLAKEEGEKIGIDVIYGLEVGVGEGKEVLLYGLESDVIGRFPELSERNLPLLSKIVRENGGVIIQAHPFRVRDYIPNTNMLDSEYLDGYEVYNKGNTKEENAKALSLAIANKKLMTAGSDSHTYQSEGRFGIACEKRIKTSKDLAEVLKSGSFELVYNDDE